jgi:GWxTD domain-containing protein
LPQFRSLFAALLVSVFLASTLPTGAAKPARNLPPVYRHWLEEEVPYIINSSERRQFLMLTTDTQRDTFIETFWKIRNPEPNSDSNSYRDEHYRRLAYANERFGVLGAKNGWRTDQGRMYIILGAPKQVVTYPAARNVRPLEIWFYQSSTLALPPYFNLIFYKRSIGEPYSLYSPNSDGPARLVSSLEALNDQKRSLDILRKSLGDEVAKTAISLLPSESVNFDDYTPSLSSDLLLSEIAGLPDNPRTTERLDENRLRDRVTTSVLTGEQPPELNYSIFRDDSGGETVSYLLRFQAPDPRLIGPGSDKNLKYDLTLRSSVLTVDGKPIYDQEEHLTGKLTEAQAVVAQKKKFAAESRLPLAPGKYNVVATLTNNLTQVATRQHGLITVPAPKSHTVGLSPLLAYTAPAATPDPLGTLPFSASKRRFTPRGAQSIYLRQGERLPLVYQLWLDPKTADSTETAKIHVHYVFGAVTASHESPSQENEEIDSSNRDTAGNLLTGHTLDTSGLSPGTYRLVVGANMDGSQQTAYESMTLHVEPAADPVETWTAYAGVAPDVKALDDLKRGLSAEAQGDDALAQKSYTKSLSEGPAELRPLDQLAALLSRNQQTEDLAALSQQPILSSVAVSPKTLLPIAQALNKSGNPKAVVRMLELQIKLQPPNADLYRTLADACEASGDNSRARNLRALAAGTS